MKTEYNLGDEKYDLQIQKIHSRYMGAIKPPVKEIEYKCTKCHEIKSRQLYYKSLNPFMYLKRIGICNECLHKLVKFEEAIEAEFFLSLLYYPFFEPLWLTALKKPEPIKYYIDMVASSEYEDMKVKSTLSNKAVKCDQQEETATEKATNEQINNITANERAELQQKWGENYNIIECLRLDAYYKDMMRDYEIKTTAHKDYLLKISKTSLAMDQALAAGDYTTYKNLSGIFDTMMKSASLADAKSKDNKADSGYNAFGLLFETIEKQGFIPVYHNDEKPDIVDKTIKNLKSWTKKLIEGDSDLSALIESAAQRLIDNPIDLPSIDEYDGIDGLDE